MPGAFLLSENLVKFWKRLYSKQPFCQCGFSTNQQSFSCAKFWFRTKINFRIWLLPVKKKAIWGILGTSRRVSLFLEKSKSGSEARHGWNAQKQVQKTYIIHNALWKVWKSTIVRYVTFTVAYTVTITVTSQWHFTSDKKASDPDPRQEHFPDPGKKVFSTSVRCFFLI